MLLETKKSSKDFCLSVDLVLGDGYKVKQLRNNLCLGLTSVYSPVICLTYIS